MHDQFTGTRYQLHTQDREFVEYLTRNADTTIYSSNLGKYII
jgi:hypothetical protein